MNQNRIRIKVFITGLFLIAAGVFLYLFNSGFLSPAYKPIVFSWQMLLIAIGLISLFSQNKRSLFGVFLIAIGGFALLPKLNIEGINFSIQNGWAIGLVIGGILIIFKAIRGKFHSHKNPECYSKSRNRMHKPNHAGIYEKHSNESGFIECNYVFGGDREIIEMANFKGGEFNSVFGSAELDLSNSQLAEGINKLEVNSIFGGIVLYVPAHWKIELRQSQVFGHFEDKRPKQGFEIDENRILILEINSVFGGGEIRCKNE